MILEHSERPCPAESPHLLAGTNIARVTGDPGIPGVARLSFAHFRAHIELKSLRLEPTYRTIA